MKRRLLLSALSCVLALGLVTACNDEEEDLSGGDTGTQTDGGGSGSDTSGSGGTTSTTLSNYTLSFAFVDEAGDPVEIPSWGAISIKGGWDNWADWITLTPKDDGTYTCTFTSIKAGTYEYKGTLWYADEEDTNWLIPVVTDPDGHDGNCTLTVAGTEGDNYTASTVTLTITEEQLTLLPEERTPAVYLSNYTIQLGLVDGSGTAVTIDSTTLDFYIVGDFTDWAFVEPEYDETSGLYSIVVSSIEANWQEFLGVTCTTGDTPDWTNTTKVAYFGEDSNAYFEVLESEGDNATRTIYWDTVNNVEYIKGAGLDVSVYFAVIDTTTATETSAIKAVNISHDAEQYEGIFTGNGDTEGWYGWSNSTTTTVTVGTTVHVAAYNATVGAMKTGEEVWITFKSDYDNQYYYFDCVVPLDLTGEVTAYTFVAYADLTVFEAWAQDVEEATVSVNEDISETVTCYEGEVTTVLASLASTSE